MHAKNFEEYLAMVNSKQTPKKARELKEAKPKKRRKKKDEKTVVIPVHPDPFHFRYLLRKK